MLKKSAYLFILIGFFLNEFTIKILSNFQTKFATIEKRLFLVFVQILFVLIGVYLLKKGKNALINILITCISLLFCLFILNLVLFVPNLQFLDSRSPVWIPYELKLNTKLNDKQHEFVSSKNPFYFNDILHNEKKDSSVFRLAVLGDSFIWGMGINDSLIWTNKLSLLLNKKSISNEILNWGLRGWSTIDHLKFLEEKGKYFEFNYLLFAFVANDPNMNHSMHKMFIDPDGFVYQKVLYPFRWLFPNAIEFLVDLTNNFANTYFDYGYVKWLEKLYTKENLEKYSLLLKEVKEYCDSKNIKFSFVLTPENYNPLLKKYFDKIKVLLDKNDIKYFDLYPYVKAELGQIPIRKLWANPADGHPGDLVTTVYANHVYDYLINDLKLASPKPKN